MKKALITLIFLCSLLLTACGTEIGDATNEKPIKAEAAKTEIAKNETVEIESTDNKSLDVYNWFVESGLIKQDMVADAYTAEVYKDLEDIISIAGVMIAQVPVMQIIEFETVEAAKKHSVEEADEEAYFLHENIFVGMFVNVKQMENYKKVVEAGKPLENLERIFYSEEQKQINQALNENDFELMSTIFNSIEDEESQKEIFQDEMYMSKFEIETVYVSPYIIHNNDDHIFSIKPDLYTEPYDPEEKNIEFDSNYMFVNSADIKTELESGEKYVIEGYIKDASTYLDLSDPEANYASAEESDAWTVVPKEIK
ncbi:hypothetical protein [Bacillus sp. D386]|uniref:hypothetical protein n=1 Tax=Bacillus sp. D386 TaxID=2587155 RepID=UPI00111F8078|nr:hypothetical protein [Bacillus sp. D386]